MALFLVIASQPGDGVEHHRGSREALRAPHDQPVGLGRIQVQHQEALGGDQHTLVTVDAVHPLLVDDGQRPFFLTVRRRGEHLPAQVDGLGQVDGEPVDAPVVDPPELRLEALAEGDDGAVGMAGEEAPHHVRRSAGPQRLALGLATGAAAEAVERVVDGVDELDGTRGSWSTASGALGLERVVVQVPQQRLGHAGQVDRNLGSQCGGTHSRTFQKISMMSWTKRQPR